MSAHGVEFLQRHEALDFGDYVREGSNVSVDTKKDMQELAQDLGKDHKRFVRELKRAQAAGYRLIVLIEERPSYNDRSKIYSWKPRFGKMRGSSIVLMMNTLEEKYGVRFQFCSKKDTARLICEYLGVPYTNGSNRNQEMH